MHTPFVVVDALASSSGWLSVNVAVAVGALTGIVIRAAMIRVLATAWFPFLGLKSLPDNWKQQLWCTDLWLPPEILPGAVSIGDALGVSYWWKEIKSGDTVYRVVALLALLVFYLPALAYRMSLKSSVWVYWPLVFSLRGAALLNDRQHMLAPAANKSFAFIKLSLAVAILDLNFGVRSYDWMSAVPLLSVVIDQLSWAQSQLPFAWLLIIPAVLLLCSTLLSFRLLALSKSERQELPIEQQFPRHPAIMKCSNILYTYLLVVLSIYVAGLVLFQLPFLQEVRGTMAAWLAYAPDFLTGTLRMIQAHYQ